MLQDFALSLKLPLSKRVGALVPAKESKDIYQRSVSMPQEEPGPSSIRTTVPFCIPHAPNYWCLNLPFGTQGRSWRLKSLSCKGEIESTEGFLY